MNVLKVLLKLIEIVDKKAWNDHINRTSKNPTQLFEYAMTKKDRTKPIFIEIKDNDKVVFRWMMFFNGYKYLRNINIVSEPTSQDDIFLEKSLRKVIQEYNPYAIYFYSITLSRFKNRSFLEKFKFDPIYEYGSSILDLKRSEEEIFSFIHPKHRNVIRKAIKENVEIYEDTSEKGVEEFYKLSVQTYKRSNKSGPNIKYLFNHFNALSLSNNCKIFFAKHGDTIDAAAFLLISDKMSIYWHGATKDNPIIGASNLLHWEMIKRLKSQGKEIYDFGGIQFSDDKNSKGYSISSFKKRFGGENNNFFGGILVTNRFKKKLSQLLQKYEDSRKNISTL